MLPRRGGGSQGKKIKVSKIAQNDFLCIFRTRTQNVEDSSILCQQHFWGENQQKLSYFHQKYQYNQTIDRLLPL